MTTSNEHTLWDFAVSTRAAVTEDEQILQDLHAALGSRPVPTRLRRAPHTAPGRRWRPAFNIAAAAVLLVAIVGAVFQTLTPSGNGGDQYANVPNVVLGLASPAGQTACDTSQDYPLFHGLDESPLDGTALLLTTSGELTLACDGERTTLLSGVRMVFSTFGPPNTVLADTVDEFTLVNVATGRKLVLPKGAGINDIFSPRRPPNSQSWYVLYSSSDPQMASAYSARTMTEYPLHDQHGEPVRIREIRASSATADDETLIVATSYTDKEGWTMTDEFIRVSTSTPGDAADAVSSIPVKRQPAPQTIAISNDSRLLATAYGEGVNPSDVAFTVLNLETGAREELWLTPSTNFNPMMGWTENDEELIFTNGSNLYAWDRDSGPEVTTLLEADEIQGTTYTRTPNVYAVSADVRDADNQLQPKTFIINRTTGETVELDGLDMFLGFLTDHRTTLVLTGSIPPGSNQALTIVDASTGEIIGEIEVPDRDATEFPGYNFSVSGWNDGDITMIALSVDSMWMLVGPDGEPTLTKIEPPELDPAMLRDNVIIDGSAQGDISLQISGGSTAWIKPAGEGEWVNIMPIAPEGSTGSSPIQWIRGED